MQPVRLIKDVDGNVLTGPRCVIGRFKEFFEKLMSEENVRKRDAQHISAVFVSTHRKVSEQAAA